MNYQRTRPVLYTIMHPQDLPDATLPAVFEEGYQSLLDECVEAEGAI